MLRPRGTGSLPTRYPTLNSTPNKDELDLSPLIATSGYLTKKSCGIGSRWLRRWWQLLGDGTLIYFKGEGRLKVLGEIDIAHTCYDVQLGGEFCHMTFPPVIPTDCCLAVSVLKRTYYLFAPSPAEAIKWSNAFRLASYLLNRNRPRGLSVNPAVLVAEEELESIPPPPPSVPPPPSSHKPPPPPPPLSSSVEESTEGEDEPKQLPRIQNLTRGRHNLSVPDLRFEYSSPKWSNGRVKSVYNSFLSSQLSTSQSSNSQPSPTQPSQAPQPSPSQPSPSQSHRRRSQSFLVNSTRTPMASSSMTSSYQENPTLQHDSSRRRYTAREGHAAGRRRSSREGIIQYRVHDKQNSNNKPSPSNWHTSHNDLTSTSTLPSPGKLTHSKWKSEFDTTAIDSTYCSRLEELQKQEVAIKRRLRELKKKDRLSYLGPTHGIPVLPRSPTENLSVPNYPFIFDNTPPTSYSQQNGIHDNYLSGVHLRRVPKKPPRKAPKPTIKRTQTPHISLDVDQLQDGEDGDGENVEPEKEKTPPLTFSDESKRKSSAIRNHEANVWVKSELTKLVEEIKLNGTHNKDDGKVVIKFGLLLDKTEGIFEALLGTILAARKHGIVNFDGDILLKGIHDNSIITLLDDSLTTPTHRYD